MLSKFVEDELSYVSIGSMESYYEERDGFDSSEAALYGHSANNDAKNGQSYLSQVGARRSI